MSNALDAPLAMELRLFGAFDVRVQGRALPPLRYRKEQWLLALLAIRHDRDVSRDWLAVTFWPDNTESQALFYLRKALSNLRKALGSEAARLLSPSTRTVRLNVTGAFSDVLLFDTALASSQTVSGHEARLLEAVDLYRGPLLQDCLDEWVTVEREARAQSYLAALETLASYALSRREAAAAVRHLQMALVTEPYRESAARSLMQALADSGDRAAIQQVYQELRRRLHADLNAAPAPETEALYHELSQQERTSIPLTSLPVAPPPSLRRLPVPLTDLIGREQEIEAVKGWLERRRLVTLVGPGGVGKTRLSIAAAEMALPNFADGVWFVDLAPQTIGAYVPEVVAKALGVPQEAGATAEARMIGALRQRSLLLVLDNCEHLLEDCAALTDQLLSSCAGLRVLATSRQALGVTGEQVYPVPSLKLPSPEELEERLPLEKEQVFLLEYPGIELFVQRAIQTDPSFRLDRRNGRKVAEICLRLDGIPLAIEMAAARLRSLSVGEIHTRLADRFRLLTSGSRSALPRQQTLRAALDWSYDLLVPEERRLLERLSVFVGGCTLEAATAVSGQADPNTCLDQLTSLVEKSLLVYERSAEPTRYRMLETIRQYCQERLQESGSIAQARGLHQQYFSDFVEGLRRQALTHPSNLALPLLLPEADNLIAALEFCLDKTDRVEQAMRFCAGLYTYWDHHGLAQGRQWTSRVLALPDTDRYTELRADLLSNMALLCYSQGDFDELSQYAEESVALSRSLKVRPEVVARSLEVLAMSYAGQHRYAEASDLFAESRLQFQQANNIGNALFALCNQALMLSDQGDLKRAYALQEECLTQFRAHGMLRGVGFALHSLSYMDYLLGDYALAERRELEALQVHRALGNRGWELVDLQHLGWICYAQGRGEESLAYCHASLRFQYEVRRKQDILVVLQCLAFHAFDAKRWRAAACLWGADSLLREALKAPTPQFHVEEYQRRLAGTEQQIGTELFQRAWEEGRQMSLEQCLAYGLAYR